MLSPPTSGPLKSLKVEFTLETSCYATMALRELTKTDTSSSFYHSLNTDNRAGEGRGTVEGEGEREGEGEGEGEGVDADEMGEFTGENTGGDVGGGAGGDGGD